MILPRTWVAGLGYSLSCFAALGTLDAGFWDVVWPVNCD
jgi:hypothetical protein